MPQYLTLDDVEVNGLDVLVRSDLNVPIEGGVITDDFRIRAALPTLERLVDSGARVSVCSHLGRPEGPDPAFSLRPVADAMAALTSKEVGFLEGGEITILENTRFEAGETSNDPAQAARLADGFDLFVQDAFGSVHRAHASTVGIADLVKSVAGPLLDAELTALRRFLVDPQIPYVVVLGGAKVSDKLGVIENLLPRVDAMLIGGGMCFTLLKAKGVEVGTSMVEEDMVDKVRGLVEGSHSEKIILPSDVVVADEFADGAEHKEVYVKDIPVGWMGLDIGRETKQLFAAVIRTAETVFWNGPMGVFEWEPFRAGTEAVARGIAEATAFTAVGGGDSVAALRMLGLESEVSHVSTGGGAGLELLEGKELPGVKVLEKWASGRDA
ncbi:MAG TPA: phosphoglycerate kinase [Acidimicrobiia bacterium]|nr:phosphoglycerate kinase [Acidimicrobiia bacterium]